MKVEEQLLGTYAKRSAPELSIYLAQLIQLSDIEVVAQLEKPLPAGWVVMVRVSSSLLALSRRDGGLRYRFGVLEGEDTSFGTLYIQGERELNLVVLDLSATDVQTLISESVQSGGMKLLLVDDDRRMRLMVPHSDTDFRLLRDAPRPNATVGIEAFTEQLGEAMRFATSDDVLMQLGLKRGALTDIQVSCVVTPQRVAEVERFLLGGVTH